MNKRSVNNLIRLIRNNKSVCINIAEYTEFLTPTLYSMLDPITKLDLLKIGLYGIVGTTKIFVSRTVPAGYIKFSELDEPDPKSNAGWSILLKLNSSKKDLDRLIDLIAFW